MLDVEKTIEDNIGLVYHHLHKHNLGFNEDAYSYALEALWKAAISFDASNGANFCTYASTCIYNQIMRYFRDTAQQQRLDTVSMDAELNEDGFSLLDNLVGDEDVCSEQYNVIQDAMCAALDKVRNDKHRQVVILWIESNFEMKQRVLAKESGLTQAQVSRIINVFRNKLKKELEVRL